MDKSGSAIRRSTASVIASLVREPFVLFAVAGAALFLAYGYLTRSESEIVVTPSIAQSLYDDAALVTGGALDVETKKRVIQQYIDDEVLFREALRRGVHLSDPKVRSRLIDLAQVIFADSIAEPSEVELGAYYAEHIDRYRIQPLTTLDVEAVASEGASTVSRRVTKASTDTLRGMFGAALATALTGLKRDVWSDPIETSQGIVRIRVIDQSPERFLDYPSAHDQVRQDFIGDRSTESIQRAVAELRRGYHIVTPKVTP
jgi:peptidyl-prolyl cis-trans isomerase C